MTSSVHGNAHCACPTQMHTVALFGFCKVESRCVSGELGPSSPLACTSRVTSVPRNVLRARPRALVSDRGVWARRHVQRVVSVISPRWGVAVSRCPPFVACLSPSRRGCLRPGSRHVPVLSDALRSTSEAPARAVPSGAGSRSRGCGPGRAALLSPLLFAGSAGASGREGRDGRRGPDGKCAGPRQAGGRAASMRPSWHFPCPLLSS